MNAWLKNSISCIVRNRIFSLFFIPPHSLLHRTKKTDYVWKEENKMKRVINDPLGQPTDPAGSDCRLIIKFWDGRTEGQ